MVSFLVKLIVFITLIIPPLMLILLHTIYYAAGIRRHGLKQFSTNKHIPKKHEVSILIPIKNEPEDLIVKAVKHLGKVLSNTESTEVLIISDDPPEIASKIASKVYETSNKLNLDVKFINRVEGPPGRAAALSYGVLHSNGDVIIILDVDSRPSKGYIESLVKCLDEGYEACVGRWTGYWDIPTKLARAITASMNFIVDTIYRGRASLGLFTYPLGSGSAFRKNSLIDVGLWDPSVIQDDMYMGAKFLNRGFKIGYVDNVNVDVLVPSTYQAFKIQQTRWAFGAANVLRRMFKYILKSPYPLIKRLEALMFLAQYVPQAILGLSLLAIPLITLICGDDVLFLNIYASVFTFMIFTAYAISFFHSLLRGHVFRLLGGSKVKLVRIMGTSGAMTLAISPLILYYTVKGLLFRTMRYKVTPKGAMERMLRSTFVFEKVITVILIALLLTVLFLGHYPFTALWLGTAIASYIYVLTNIEKVVK